MSETTLDIIALGENNDVLHFSYSETVGWSLFEPTALTVRHIPSFGRYRYEITDGLLVKKSNSTTIDVYGTNAYNHLIHYIYEVGMGWNAEDVTEKISSGAERVTGLFAVASRNDAQDIFFVNSLGKLHRYYVRSGGSWAHEDVSSRLYTNVKFEGTPSVDYIGGSTYPTFCARTSQFKLFIAGQLSSGSWIGSSIIGQYAIEKDPVMIKRTPNITDIFVSDLNSSVLHFYSGSSGYQFENLSDLYPYSYLPSLYIKNLNISHHAGNRIDVFGTSISGKIVHFHRAGFLGCPDRFNRQQRRKELHNVHCVIRQ